MFKKILEIPKWIWVIIMWLWSLLVMAFGIVIVAIVFGYMLNYAMVLAATLLPFLTIATMDTGMIISMIIIVDVLMLIFLREMPKFPDIKL